MKRVYIPNIKKYIEVNDDDFDKVSAYRWYITYAHGTQRCLAYINGKKIVLVYIKAYIFLKKLPNIKLVSMLTENIFF